MPCPSLNPCGLEIKSVLEVSKAQLQGVGLNGSRSDKSRSFSEDRASVNATIIFWLCRFELLRMPQAAAKIVCNSTHQANPAILKRNNANLVTSSRRWDSDCQATRNCGLIAIVNLIGLLAYAGRLNFLVVRPVPFLETGNGAHHRPAGGSP